MRICLAALAAALLALAAPALAQTAPWPTRPIKIIVNYQPGGSTDNATRPYTQPLAAILGQQVVIENKGGASGAIGLEAAAKSPPDGYTFVTTPVASPVIVPQARKVGYDTFKDLAPVSRFADYTVILTAHPSLGVSSIPELVALSKRKPGTLNLGGVGVGTLTQLIAIMLNKQSGTDIAYVPYRGAGEALPDFLAGVVQLYLDPNAMPHVQAGKVKLISVVDSARLSEYPDVPMLSELYPELDFVGWMGMYAPAGTPPDIIRKMSDAMNKVSATPEMAATLQKFGLRPRQSSPEQFAADTKRDWDRYGAIIREAKITMD